MLPPGRIAWIALAILLVGLPSVVVASPSVPADPSGPAAVRLLEPADGAVLSGGSTVTLAWEPGPAVDLGSVVPGGADEWEAFLSLDGGATWPIRITPHLDLALRRVVFPVPSLPSNDVRLLLRVGDERGEVPIDLPGTFSISARPSALLSAAVTRYGTGEAALPGGRGVVAWVEGTRRGGDLRTAVALPLADGWTAVPVASLGDLPWAGETEPPTEDLVSPLGVLATPPVPKPPAERARPRPRPAPPGARAILLTIERLDE